MSTASTRSQPEKVTPEGQSFFYYHIWPVVTDIVSLCIYGLITLVQRLTDLYKTPAVLYDEISLTSITKRRLESVKRKTLVLDLDETLIHSSPSNSKGVPLSRHSAVTQVQRQQQQRQSENGKSNATSNIFQTIYYTCSHSLNSILSLIFTTSNSKNYLKYNETKPDFNLPLIMQRKRINFLVRKRPHVDYFLRQVSKWYDLVIFTASLELYGSAVCDVLEKDSNVKFRKRFYRQHCIQEGTQSYTKDLTVVSQDLANVLILDNSPGAYRLFPDNAIPIKSFVGSANDDYLLGILPMLDCLRFCSDVRNILSRSKYVHTEPEFSMNKYT